MIKKYDVLVLGTGPAGFYSALTCAKGGLKTAVVERAVMGGTGFASGCLPVKILLDKIKSIRNMEKMAGQWESSFNSMSFYKHAFNEIGSHEQLVSSHSKDRFQKSGIDFYQSDGHFCDKNTYKIDKGKISADRIIIATGTEPDLFKGNSFGSGILNHSDVFKLKSIPGEITIIGGDVEGIEFASLLSQLGTRVRIIEQMSMILPGYDRDLVLPIIDELEKKNVEFFCSTKVLKIFEANDEHIIASENKKFHTSQILITGLRKPSIPQGAEALGLKLKDGFIQVDRNYESSIPGIYAVGDINGILGMAGAASQQAVQLGDYLLKGRDIQSDYSILPRAVFSVPGICGGGIQENDLKNPEEYQIKVFPLKQCWRTMYTAGIDDFVKIIIDKDEIVMGIWFSGDGVDVFGSSIGIYLKNKLTLDDLRRDLYVHPTAFESLFEAGL